MRYLIVIALLAFAAAVSLPLRAESEAGVPAVEGDELDISLVTCGAGQEVYSLYGHTALRFIDHAEGVDIAVNYGVFSFDKPFFILRFIFGLTDYEMGICPWQVFLNEYRRTGRSVVEQRLNLTTSEKQAIKAALINNYRPANRTYRYNYFYDNCTTRARDIVRLNIPTTAGKASGEPYPTFRELIHECNGDSPWARFGNDLLLGVLADRPTSYEQQQFLPGRLLQDISSTVVKDSNNGERPLVASTTKVYTPPATAAEEGWQSVCRPLTVALLVLLLSLGATLYEWRSGRVLWLFDAAWMTIIGLAGILTTAMLFSKHPTVSTNLQVLLLNPLPLFFVYRTARHARQQARHSTSNSRPDSFWRYAIWAMAAFFIGGTFQHYAEGMYVLALALLIRIVWRWRTAQQQTTDTTCSK